MKNQALTITLAVLLALSLAAVGVLFVTGSGGDSTVVIGPNPPVATAGVTAVDQQASPTPTPVDNATGDDTPATPNAVTPADDGPSDEAPADDTPAPSDDTPTAPADDTPPPSDDTPTAPADDTPAPSDDTPDDDSPAPGDDAPAVPADDEPADDDAPADDDDDEPADPPCAGPVLDGICTPAICFVGHAWSHDAQTCVFVGCPEHLVLVNGWCEVPEVGPAPCGIGEYRNDDGDCVPFVHVDPGALCGEGLKLLNGECVSVCPHNHTWIGGFCLEINIPDYEVNPDFLPDFDHDLVSPDFDVEFDPALILDLAFGTLAD